MSRLLVIAGVALLLIGCRTAPFRALPEGRAPAPAVVRERWRTVAPSRYSQTSSVVFRFWWKQVAGIGHLHVDAPRDTVALTCLTPFGTTLLRVVVRGNEVTVDTPVPELRDRPQIGQAIAADLRCVYLDLVPPAGAVADRAGDAVRFTATGGDNRIVYTFAGTAGDLVDKRADGWRAGYYDYVDHYPREVVFRNGKYGYSLVIRAKETRPKGGWQAAHE